MRLTKEACSPRLSRRRLLMVLTAAGAGGLLAACAAPAAPTAPTVSTAPPSGAQGDSASAAPTTAAAPLSPPVTLMVTDSQSAANAALYIAQDRGYFKDEGVQIQTVNLGLEEQIPQLGTGQLDVGLNSLLPGLINAVARGVGLSIIATAISHEPGRSYPIVARTDLVESGQLNSYSDLKGKTYSTTAIPSIAVYAIEKALTLGGLKLDDMNLLALSFPNIAAALATRQVDVAFLSEPFATNAFDKGIAVKWREQADFLPSHPQSIWLGSQKLLTDKIEAGRRFMVSMVQGARDYEDAFGKNKGRQAVVDILINHTTVKDAALYDKLNWAKMPENGEVRTDLLKEDVDWLVAQGSIPEVPELSRLVDARLTDYAVQRLGPSR